ncbi:MAG: YqcC family protein [Candidatus Micrarchaeia archaeon]
MAFYEAVLESVWRKESEMRRMLDKPLEPWRYGFKEAFGTVWLQYIFIPRVRKIIEGRSEFPGKSEVGMKTVREFDGYPEAGKPVELLCAFDELF